MTTSASLPLVGDPRPAPSTPFEHAVHDFFTDFFTDYPVWATAVGYHLVDDRWTDATEAGRRARLGMIGRHRAAFQAMDEAGLSADERIDRGIVLDIVDQLTFDEDVLREDTWDPLAYVYLLGSGFFGLLARDYAPWAHRGAAFIGRADGVAAVLAAGRANLVGRPGRPVALLHLETALAQLPGVGELIDQGVEEAHRRAAAGEAPELVATIEASGARAKAAVEEFRQALDTEIRARASGEGRLGPELFQQKLRHTLSSDMTFDQIRERGWREYHAVRREMVRLAREAWPTFVPDEPMPAAGGLAEAESEDEIDSRIVRTVLDRVAGQHRRPEELLAWCEAEVRSIEAYCREHDIIGLPDEPLKVTWTPVFMRAYGRAFLDSPGVLDKGQSAYFWITPPDDDAKPEDVESYLREDNDRMLRLLSIHEGVPGHYLQLAYSNRSPSLVRTVFSNGMFAEGWAVYVTQVMMDLGYGRDDPALMLTHWKFYLRAVMNALMDVEIHAGSMDEAAAMDLMLRGGFQEPDEARGKWLRARITSTQLCTYYLGSLEMWDMEVAARQAAAVAAGAGPDAVPDQKIVGQLGQTPGFDYRRHLESVISHGTPAIKWVARILADEGAGGRTSAG